MWFGLRDDIGVELPEELVSAHAEGSLVLFVGAGASVETPSCLPTFEKLTEGGIDEFPSLAFPQRDDFTGIVYLHGSVKEPPEHLVVTDADFGQVYLDAPWTAAQFLSRVFRHNTVLFIGNSLAPCILSHKIPHNASTSRFTKSFVP